MPKVCVINKKFAFRISFLSNFLICKFLSKSKYIGIAPKRRIDNITNGKLNFEISTLLFF